MRSRGIRNQISLAITVILIAGCSRRSPEEPRESAVAQSSAAQLFRQLGPGAFRVTGVGTTGSGASRYLATIDGPPICQFQVWIEKSNQEGMRFSFAEAALLRQPGSDCTAYLRELARQFAASCRDRHQPIASLLRSPSSEPANRVRPALTRGHSPRHLPGTGLQRSSFLPMAWGRCT